MTEEFDPTLHPADIADALQQMPAEEAVERLRELSPETASEVLSELDEEITSSITPLLSLKEISELLEELPHDEAADIAAELTPEQQAAAWDAYIDQDPYLSTRRGQYAERNALFLPMIWRADLSITQDLFGKVGGKLNKFQVRLDILNFTNFLKDSWGVSQRVIQNRPLTNPSLNGAGELQYRLATNGGELLNTTFQKNAGFNDVYRFQLSLRYLFN